MIKNELTYLTRKWALAFDVFLNIFWCTLTIIQRNETMSLAARCFQSFDTHSIDLHRLRWRLLIKQSLQIFGILGTKPKESKLSITIGDVVSIPGEHIQNIKGPLTLDIDAIENDGT